jgi:gluconolactonase
VQGILTLPAGPVSSLSFGGPGFTQLYIICGGRIYRRPLQVPGVPCFAPPMPLPELTRG